MKSHDFNTSPHENIKLAKGHEDTQSKNKNKMNSSSRIKLLATSFKTTVYRQNGKSRIKSK